MMEKGLHSYFIRLREKGITNHKIAVALAGAGISVSINGDIFRISGTTECAGVRINPRLLSLVLKPEDATTEILLKRAKKIGELETDAPEEAIAPAA